MKKFILLLGMICFIGANVMADEPEEEEQDVNLEVYIIDPIGNGNNIPRSPMLLPYVTYSNSGINFKTAHSQYLLQIVGSDDVVYQTIVYPTDYNVSLPYLPLGQYEILLISGNYVLYGYFMIK